MKFEVRCKNCREHFSFHMYATDRPELARRKGKSLDLKCKDCGMPNKYQLNEIQAIESRSALLVSLIIFLAGPPVMFFFLNDVLIKPQFIYYVLDTTLILGMPSGVFMLMRKNERDKVDRFNRYKIKEN